jgi:hypothetical protein
LKPVQLLRLKVFRERKIHQETALDGNELQEIRKDQRKKAGVGKGLWLNSGSGAVLDQPDIIHINVPDRLPCSGRASVIDEIQLIKGACGRHGSDLWGESDIPSHGLGTREQGRRIAGDRRKIGGGVVAGD